MYSETRRILMINDHIHFGGGGDAVFRLEREAYVQAGWEVFTFSHGGHIDEGSSGHDIVCREGRNRLAAKCGKFVCNPTVYCALRKALRLVQPDLVRAHLISKYPADVYPALDGYPVIQTLHGPNLFCATSWGNLRRDGSQCELGIGLKCYRRGCVHPLQMLLYTSLYQRVKRRAKRVVLLYHCPSKHIQESAESLGFAPAVHIPLGIDDEFINAKPATHEGPSTILYAGALAEQKGLLFLPEALARVKRRLLDVRLVLVGQGPLEPLLRREFSQRGLAGNVEFRGNIDHREMVGVYRGAHVLVLPSIWKEQFGLVGPEALACGVPCVGSDIGGIPEWLHDGKCGFTVPPRNAEALAARLCLLLESRELRLRFGASGRAFASNEYSPDRYRSRLLGLVREYASR